MKSQNLRIRVCQKKCINNGQIEIARDCINKRLNPNEFFFFLFGKCYMIVPCYLHSTYIVFIFFALFTGYEDENFRLEKKINLQV